MLQEAKAKFFDLQRVIETKQNELNHLIDLRVGLVQQIERLEKEPVEEGLKDEEPITA
jgi:hypothetical protein